MTEALNRVRKGRSALLRRRPDLTHDYSSSHLGRGEDYDQSFDDHAYRALMWRMEQRVLAGLLTELLGTVDPGVVLDFACGTGRITELVLATLPRARVTGVDIAASMLEVARARVPGATFLDVDGAALAASVPAASVDLVTAFRFFPNADEPLRHAAAASLAEVVRPGGHVVLNNHRNFWSPSYVIRRSRRGAPAPGARNADVLGPFLDRGFRVVDHHSLGVLPASEDGAYGVPLGLASRCEWFNLRRLRSAHTLGSNTIWVLRKRS
ncbi:MAG: class I SAM-dependent DNA methyltransferase [Marmoricola sp.]